MRTLGDAFSLILGAKSSAFRTDFYQVTGNKVMMNCSLDLTAGKIAPAIIYILGMWLSGTCDVTLNSPFDLQSKPKEYLMESLVFDPWLKF